MTLPSARHRRVPTCVTLETRDPPAGLGVAAAALALYDSPVVAAARTAALVYHAGQLAYTGHTSFLLGTVRVTQPYPLKSLGGLHPRPFPPPRAPAVRGPGLNQVPSSVTPPGLRLSPDLAGDGSGRDANAAEGEHQDGHQGEHQDGHRGDD